MKTRQTFDFPLPRLAPSTQKDENLYKEKKRYESSVVPLNVC